MNYYKTLPEGYKEIASVDAQDKKMGIWLNVIGAVIMVGIVVGTWFGKGFTKDVFVQSPFYSLAACLGIFLYLVIHELVHGLFYKIFTGGKKLTFGFSWSCAFCGMPQLYMTRVPMIVTAMAPCVIFTILFGAIVLALPANAAAFYMSVIFAIHFGGCIGDLYVSWLMAFVYPNDVLINDTGAKQTFYSAK